MSVQDDLPGIPFADRAPYQMGDVAVSPSTGQAWARYGTEPSWIGPAHTSAASPAWRWYFSRDLPADTRLVIRAGKLLTPPYDPATAEPGDVVASENDERTFFFAPDDPRDYRPWIGSDGAYIGPDDLPAGLTLVLRGGKPVAS